MTVTELLADHPDPTDDQIKESLGGNLCRCTGYTKIIEAVHEAVALGPARSAGEGDGSRAGAGREDLAPDATNEGWTPGPGDSQVTLPEAEDRP
jgi:xanthine dehydrogenase iron-sulfur cluster and FAD-binding subunit A